ncbi:MAG: AraC family transcriptional regulator [Acutalibacteraceae bacterium]
MKYDSRMEKIAETIGDIPIKYKNFCFDKTVECFQHHWHENFELLFIDGGELTVEADGDRKVLTPGYAAVFSPHCVHYGKTGAKGASYRMIMFDAELFINKTPVIKYYIDRLVNSKIEFVHFIYDEKLKTLFNTLCGEIIKAKSPMEIQGHLYILLSYLFERYLSETIGGLSPSSRFDCVTDYITEHYKEDITTSLLCEKFGYNEAYFCRRFKAEIGCTPTEYICVTRLERSKRLLKLGQKVSDAARQCGFADAGYYSKCFFKHYNISPSRFAKSYKSADSGLR